MMHLPLLPVLVPLAAAILMLALHRADIRLARGIALVSVGGLAVVAVLLLRQAAGGTVAVVALGNWPAPFGIVFVADRLAALMVATTVAIAVPALLAACGGIDRGGRHFHPFFQMQLAGLNGAFLTGDLFNLFVFFELLLIASYGLLVHGGGAARVRAGLHYVVLNLAGSVLFLIGLGLLYGTLNLADVAERLATVPPGDAAPLRVALALLVAVFALKAALLPLGFWLPHAYGAASAPAAALFAVLTKVGIYALVRLSSVAFDAAPGAGLFSPWLLPMALATVAVATAGVLAARRLAAMVAHLLLLSTGMLAAALAEGGMPMLAALLYYLPHTTLVSAALFLLVGRIAAARGEAGDRLIRSARMPGDAWLGTAFLVLAVAVSGLPPLSGFLGKLMMLSAAPATAAGYVLWAVFILSGFVAALGLARAASTLFWERGRVEVPLVPAAGRAATWALLLALGCVPALVLGAAPLSAYARATAEQLAARQPYLQAVLPGGVAAVAREVRP
ncbi:monovalent cation/H+ antiporter subunit D [Dankookia sp. GCM10030260]|uniref:monovalent cation/H+ antiporter subunit D n=1 Tax=Dankookia sp. GCM10030260 TaxID=3273390 RepID=UPI003619BE3E